jgi:hypothetical protein
MPAAKSQAPRIPARSRTEPVHFTGGERLACEGGGHWRTVNIRLVTCPDCKRTRTFREMAARERDPLEVCAGAEEAFGERLRFWAAKLTTGPVGKTGLHRRYGIEPRLMRTATGPAWGLFLSPHEEGAVEYVESP